MLKIANVLLAFFLALAPGMDAVRLLHGLDLCECVGGAETHLHGAIVAAHDHDGPCRNSDKHPPQDECPHLKNLSLGGSVMVSFGPLPFDQPAAPFSLAPQCLARPHTTTCPPTHQVRPPPGPPRLGCVLLQV
ncbi:MAG: hypothetical protein IPP14_02955 [Planctomycetes bacterium]|nr:hypothetical protein [Planctomycetota bacterium]